jgi:membrane protein YqaA with SNARE-associated domain
MKIIRRLYDWVLSWAETPYGSPALFVLAFVESSFFPIPPDTLQIALSAGKPRRAFWYATISLIGSVLGALLGYYIGYKFWEAAQEFFFANIFNRRNFEFVESQYHQNAFWSIFVAAFTPIPYKIFTVAAGVCQIPLFTMIFASIIGRGMRFYAVATLMFCFGPLIKKWIDKYFDLLAVVFTILLIGGFVVVNYIR